MATDGQSAPRRLSRRARRDQLVAAAVPLLARHGPADLSLDDVAQRVGVTRNLLYHYFPGGRDDLVSAVVVEMSQQLLGPPGPADLDETLTRILDHALAPTHAWRIHRLARGLPALGPSLEASVGRVTQALLQATGGGPSPHTDLALRGFVAFAETILDEARGAGIPRAEVRALLERTLRAILAAA